MLLKSTIRKKRRESEIDVGIQPRLPTTLGSFQHKKWKDGLEKRINSLEIKKGKKKHVVEK